MKPELQAALYAKYPTLFRDRDKSPQESCLHWGIETGDGWFDILDHLGYALSRLYSTGFMTAGEWMNVEPPQVVADQVKEKMSTLRFYHHLEFPDSFRELAKIYPDAQEIADRYSDYIDGMVDMAERMSERVCEDTGKPGELHVSGGTRYGWYRTLNREYAKTDPKMVERNYVPVADLPRESEIELANGSTITATETSDAVRGFEEAQ